VTGPRSRRVTHEDRQGIEALFVAAADAWRKEDMETLMTLYDLPITRARAMRPAPISRRLSAVTNSCARF
jgi:hypothetical protein